MAMNTRHSLLAALALAVAVAGCAPRARHAEPPPPPGVAPAPAGLKFSVKIKPARFAVGERVVLEATLFNDSTGSFKQDFPTTCTWDYEVTAADGRVVGPERTCEPRGEELRLEKGELRVIMREWKGRDRYFNAREPLAPGTYRVTAGFIDESHRVVPMADAVTVEILAR
jgi:hypothetical protein